MSFRQTVKIDFGNRKNFRWIADQSDIEFTAVNVLFDDRRLPQNFADVFDFLIQMIHVMNHRIMINADACIFMLRFDNQRKIDRRFFHRLIGDKKTGRADAGAFQTGACCDLCSRSVQEPTPRAGVFNTDQFQQRRNVRFPEIVAADVFAQVDRKLVPFLDQRQDHINGIVACRSE